MKITNTKSTFTANSHVINPRIVEVKLPNLGIGKNWKAKKTKLNGEQIELNYNSARPTGVYFRYNDNVNYVKEREILDAGVLKIVERKSNEAGGETRQAETDR